MYKRQVLKKIKQQNPKRIEVLLTTGSIKGCPQKVAVVACYIPPIYTVPRAREAMDFIANSVTQVKNLLDDPLVIVAGDFNQWKLKLTSGIIRTYPSTQSEICEVFTVLIIFFQILTSKCLVLSHHSRQIGWRGTAQRSRTTWWPLSNHLFAYKMID